jgi:hypothetical protein
LEFIESTRQKPITILKAKKKTPETLRFQASLPVLCGIDPTTAPDLPLPPACWRSIFVDRRGCPLDCIRGGPEGSLAANVPTLLLASIPKTRTSFNLAGAGSLAKTTLRLP